MRHWLTMRLCLLSDYGAPAAVQPAAVCPLILKSLIRVLHYSCARRPSEGLLMSSELKGVTRQVLISIRRGNHRAYGDHQSAGVPVIV